MEKPNEVIELIRERKNISVNKIEKIKVTGDGNCLYRSLSYYLYETEDKYNDVRQEIYTHANSHKDTIKEFFLEDKLINMTL